MFAALTKEFQFLASTGNQSAVDCLCGLLDSSDRSVRWQAGFALSSRSDRLSQEKFLEAFDSPSRLCRREWKTIGYRLVATIMKVLEDPTHRLYRAALKAISDCEIVEGFTRLVRTAEQISLPHGSFAGKQLLQLATHLGTEARNGGAASSVRTSLLGLLAASLDQFHVHRSATIADAFLACVDAGDADLLGILNQNEDAVMKILTRQWKSTQRIEVLELLVDLLDKPFLPKSICNVLFKERTDEKMALALAKRTREGLSLLTLQRIQQNGIPECCRNLSLKYTSLSEQDLWTLWTIMAAGQAPLRRLLQGICVFLDNPSTESHLAITKILRHYPTTPCVKFLEAMAPEAMLQQVSFSQRSLHEPVDDGSQFRQDIRKLLLVLPNCDPNLRKAIEEFFVEFNIETLLQHLGLLMDDAIHCFAEIMRSLHPTWPQMLIPALESPDGERRCQAAIAASYLGPHPDIKAAITKLLQDKYTMVQEEAAHALKAYPASNTPAAPHSRPAIAAFTEAKL